MAEEKPVLTHNQFRIRPTTNTPNVATEPDIRYANGTDWDPGSGKGFYYYDGSAWQPFGGGDGAYDIGGFMPDKPTASQMIHRHVFTRSVDFPANLTGSKASARVAAAAQTDYDLKKNGTSFGTMRFAASATTCTFVGVSATSFAAADVLTVIAPASPDADLADMGWTLAGVKA